MENKVAKIVMVVITLATALAEECRTMPIVFGKPEYGSRTVCGPTAYERRQRLFDGINSAFKSPVQNPPAEYNRPAQSVTCRTEPIIFGQPQYGFRTVCN
jgi:hypothetical protein